LAEINDWLAALPSQHAGVTVEDVDGIRTHENRTIKMVTISKNSVSLKSTILSKIIVKMYFLREIEQSSLNLTFMQGNSFLNNYRSQITLIFVSLTVREWISSASTLWFINELLTSNDPAVVNARETIDWYILPMMSKFKSKRKFFQNF
jgi:Zinc carboxypeptidase